MKKKYASDLLEGIHESAQGLFKIGAISAKELKEFDELCFEPDGSVTDINPFAELTKSDYQSLADQVEVSVSFIHKLKNKSIIYSTIPQSFLKKVSEVIGIHVNQLVAYLSSNQDAQFDEQVSGRGKKNYSDKKLSFENALKSSGLNPLEVKSRLRNIQQHLSGYYPIGRLVVDGKACFSPNEGGKFLQNTIKNYWPQNTNVDFLITPGAFINNVLNEKKCAKLEEIGEFERFARENVEIMLNSSRLLTHALGKVKYLSIGSDIHCPEGNRAELVYLVNVKTGNIDHWTGNSYPTNELEARTLVQVSDLSSHFKNILNHRVMILGGHDLNMFIQYKHNKSSTHKAKIRSEMNKLAREFKPTIVIQHPHTTHSPRSSSAWNNLERNIPTVKAKASGISYFATNGDTLSPIDKVLISTKSGTDSVVDIFMEKN